MKWFNNLPMLAKLLSTFALMSALTLAVGVTGYHGLDVMNTMLTDDVGSETLPSLIDLSQAYLNLNAAAKDMRSALLMTDGQQIAVYSNKFRDDLAASDAAFAAYVALPHSTTEVATAIREYQVARAAYGPLTEKVLVGAALNTPEDHAAAVDTLFNDGAPTLAKIIGSLDRLTSIEREGAEQAIADGRATYQQALQTLVVLVAGAITAAIVVGIVVARSISMPLAIITDFANHVAEGDTAYDVGDAKRARVRRRDEVGKIGDAMTALRAYVGESVAVAQAVANGDLTATVNLRSERDLLGNALLQMLDGLRSIVSQVSISSDALAESAEQLGSASAQAGSAVQQVSTAIQNVAAGAQDTSRTAQDTNHAVSQLRQVVDGIARGANEQAQQVQTTGASAAQMAADVEQVASNASAVAAAGEQTRAAAQTGGVAVQQTTQAMEEIKVVVSAAADKVHELGRLGERIGVVVETIDDIAEQTNLLALNAAIEAARAGEHGRGFAVVADAVRKLAERSSRETKQISELIEQVQHATTDAVEAMARGSHEVELGAQMAHQTRVALNEIVDAVEKTSQQVTDIASAAQAMAGESRQVKDALHSISAVIEENSAATEEMAAQSGQVADAIQSVAAVSEEQSAATEEVSASAEQMSAQIEEMSAQAQELAATAEQLKGLVQRFRLENASTSAVQPVEFSRGLRRAA